MNDAMKALLVEIKIWWLKRRVRSMMLRYRSNYSDMSCGAHLGSVIRGSDRSLVKKINATLDRLSEIDPECPARRLEEQR